MKTYHPIASTCGCSEHDSYGKAGGWLGTLMEMAMKWSLQCLIINTLFDVILDVCFSGLRRYGNWDSGILQAKMLLLSAL